MAVCSRLLRIQARARAALERREKERDVLVAEKWQLSDQLVGEPLWRGNSGGGWAMASVKNAVVDAVPSVPSFIPCRFLQRLADVEKAALTEQLVRATVGVGCVVVGVESVTANGFLFLIPRDLVCGGIV